MFKPERCSQSAVVNRRTHNNSLRKGTPSTQGTASAYMCGLGSAEHRCTSTGTCGTESGL
jgi:hypothetical protein